MRSTHGEDNEIKNQDCNNLTETLRPISHSAALVIAKEWFIERMKRFLSQSRGVE